ncbi:MAG TPA: ATP-binding protein [Solirubrobacterales bacterium]|nr:ATP-binding protein [Solirubrobacterales bacterium]
MPWELAELAGGAPFAVSFAFAGAVFSLRAERRRSTLNEALHELRRPLQALALLVREEDDAVDSTLRLATAALARLDREVNGGGDPASGGPVSIRPLVEAAVERWRPRAAALERSLEARWTGAEVSVPEAGFALAQALDNLISNGLDHGSGTVAVEGRAAAAGLDLIVRDQGPARRRREGRWRRLRAWRGARGRHGHGLRVVRRTAAELGGSFRLRCGDGGTEAVLLLPAWRAEG